MSKLTSFFGRPIGCFSNVFTGPTQERAKAIVEHGFTCVQWWPEQETKDLTTNVAKEECRIFQDAGLTVVALAGYQNIIAPDPSMKTAALERMKRLFDIAPIFGPGCGVATETGTKNSNDPWKGSPLNTEPYVWQEMLESVAALAQHAQRSGSRLLIEGYVENVVRTADDVVRLREALPNANLGFVMDPFNLILEPQVPTHRDELLRIFSAIGTATPIAHAKDLLYTDGVVATPRAGTGVFDYTVYFKLLDAKLPTLPLVLEHLQASEVSTTLDYLKQRYEESKK